MLLNFLLQLDQFNHTVVHFFDGLVLGESHATLPEKASAYFVIELVTAIAHLIRNVIDSADGIRMFAGRPTDLQVIARSHFVELVQVFADFWQLDVHTGSNCSACGKTVRRKIIVKKKGNL